MKAVKESLYWLDKNRNALFYPVGRKLFLCALAYLTGIYCAALWIPALLISCALIAVFSLTLIWFKKTGRTVLFPVCLLFLIAGVMMGGSQLLLSDTPTKPNTPISGTIVRIESDYRVMLGDVSLPDGGKTNRPVVVTLMNDEEVPLPQPPKVGQRISGTGRLFAQDGARNPGDIDQRMRALCDGFELSGYILPGWNAAGEERFSFSELFRSLRLSLTQWLNRCFGEHAGLFAALMLGEKKGVDPELKNAMRLTGTVHVLSVSGMHLSMIAAAVYALLRLLPLGRKAASFLQAVILFFFAGLTGFAVGTLRALIMQLLRILARLCGRRYDPLTALACSALAITAVSPLMVFDAAFQFSFFVVLGILLLMNPMLKLPLMCWLHEKAEWLAEMIALSLSAQLAALPMQLSLYGYVPLLALPMNLLTSILIPVLMIGGWCLLLVGCLFSDAASLGAWVLALPAQLLEQLSLGAASLRGGILRLPSPGRTILPLFGACMALISTRVRFGRLRYRCFALMFLLIAALYLPRLNPAVRYVQLDVGQGDASLIRSGNRAVVIDVGPADSYDLLRYLRHEGLYLDAVILSHLDEDHAGALHTLRESEIGIPRIIMAKDAMLDAESPEVLSALSLLEADGIVPEYVEAGDRFDAMNLKFDVLSPLPAYTGSNERSLLLHVRAAENDLLLTGDLPTDCEPDSISPCDILKVAHHGSQYASSGDFLNRTQADIAVISVGASNSYGHPHERVLDDLKAIGAKVLRTDHSGCITLWLGGEVRAETFL